MAPSAALTLTTRSGTIEYDKWSEIGSTPEHELIVPFTRMLAGPLDYHHGAFRAVPWKEFAPRNVAPCVIGTRARMLALYVVYEDPLPMVADYPEAYRGQPGFDFIVRVPTVWDETRVIAAEPGDLLAVARRRGTEWYAGAMTDGQSRELALPRGFLAGGDYRMDLRADPSASTASANELSAETFTVDAGTVVRLRLAPAGGAALHLVPASGDGARPPRYSAAR